MTMRWITARRNWELVEPGGCKHVCNSLDVALRLAKHLGYDAVTLLPTW